MIYLLYFFNFVRHILAIFYKTSAIPLLFKQKHGDPKSAEIYQAQKEKFEELYAGIASKYDEDCSSAKAGYAAQCKSEYIEHLAQIPEFSIDGNNLKHGDTVIGTITIDVKGTPCCSITPNKEFAPLCRQFQKEADALPALNFSPFIPPERPEIPEFKAPAAPIPIPMPTSGDPNEAIGKLLSAYDAKGKFELAFDDDGKISVLSNGTKICEANISMQGGTPHLYLSNPENIHQDMAAFGKQFAEHIGQNRWLQYEAPKEEAKIAPSTLSSEICDHPSVTIPDAPEPEEHVKGNAEYLASRDAAYATHLQACEQSAVDQMRESIKEQVLAAANAKIPKGRGELSISEDGKLMLNKGDSATELGSFDVKLEDGKWSVDITPNEGKAQLCRVLHLQANTMQFKQPEISLPEFKAPTPPAKPEEPAPKPAEDPTQPVKAMTFAKERAARLASKADTKKIAAMQMQAPLKPGDWSAIATAFIKHMNGLKDKEAEYAKGDTSPSYMKAYQDEGKNFYQAMNIQKVSDTQIRISGTDPDLSGETYCTDIHYNPSTETVTTKMDAPASEKQILATAEYMRQVALKSGGNTLTISASDDMEGLKQTISIFNSQGLNIELSPVVKEQLKEHIRREFIEEHGGRRPSQEDISAEFDKIMKDKYVVPNPATTPPPPPSEPQARSSAPSQKQPRMK